MNTFRSKSRLRSLVSISLAAMLAISLVGCSKKATTTDSGATTTVTKSSLVLASTTSTQDSGLFDVLIPEFTKAYPQYDVKVIAVGTGEALKLGQNKDADVLLVHSKAQEEAFVKSGYGTGRFDVMYNDFIIVGPASDPAGIKAKPQASGAMKTLATAGAAGKAIFVSRGDASGTNTKELGLWKLASVVPTATGNWYISTGQGMGETLKITSEKKTAYTLTDRATYLSMKSALDLTVLYEKQTDLLNQYGVIPVTGAKNAQGAKDFGTWILSAAGQKVIGEYGVAKYGQQLFIPNASASTTKTP